MHHDKAGRLRLLSTLAVSLPGPLLSTLLGTLLGLVLGACGGSGGTSSTSSSTADTCSGAHAYATPAVTQTAVTHFGRRVTPLGQLSNVGNFPTGGQITPDGRYFWALDAGRSVNYLWILDAATGAVVQQIPMAGTSGSLVFAPDGLHAYVSGEPMGDESFPAGTPAPVAPQGDAIHVFAINPATGQASEQAPIAIPSTADSTIPVGASRKLNSQISGGGDPHTFTEWPRGIAITPDGKTLLVALENSDRAAIIDIASAAVTVLPVGTYPHGAAIERSGRFGYISNEYDGSLTRIDLAARRVLGQIALGLDAAASASAAAGTTADGTASAHATASPAPGDRNAHPEALLADPDSDQLYVAVTDRDLLMVLDTVHNRFTQQVNLARSGGLGVSPVGLARSADACTLYVAEAYTDSVAAIALKDRRDSSVKAFERIGEIPVGDYPTAVRVSPDDRQLLWIAGKGMGANPGSGDQPPAQIKQFWQNGIVGRLSRPDDAFFQQMSATVTANLQADAEPEPAHNALLGAARADGSRAPSEQIRYVFIVTKENRTYDNIFATVPRGDGAPNLELYEDNCGPQNTAFEGPDRNFPGCGITPNAHALSRQFLLLDHFMANSEQSTDGHIYTTGGYLNDYTQRNLHEQTSGRGRPYDYGLYPVTYPPQAFLFDQLYHAGIGMRIYGERAGGLYPFPGAAGGRDDFAALQADVMADYPINGLGGCLITTPDPAPQFNGCVYDSGRLGQSRASGANVPPDHAISRVDLFARDFQARVAAGTWPQFAYILTFNDHGYGDTPGQLTTPALAADNDLALGQIVDVISHSSLWPHAAIFVMEDDSQDGADHVDSHRMPAYVISPWSAHGGVTVSHRYDQLSMIRSVELIFGLPPLSLLHALAVPMLDAFIDPTSQAPDYTPYNAIAPERSLVEQNSSSAAVQRLQHSAPQLLKLSRAMPWERPDAVPQEIADRILYANIWGDDAHYPGPGPNASAAEQSRARAAREAFAQGRDLHSVLQADDDDD